MGDDTNDKKEDIKTPEAEEVVAVAIAEEEPDTISPNDIDIDPKVALTDEPVKVKLLPASSPQNDEPVTKPSKAVVGYLNKKELMAYTDMPFWVRIRWGFFILFWLIWLSMLSSSILIVFLAPKCPPPQERSWWQRSPIYQVYVRSFNDTNQDGIGDLKGVESKLDYIKSLGVESLWLSPIYKSPMADFGYDIEDHKAIDEIFGTMEDFESLISEVNKRDMKLIMDFIPNHTSKKHPWFIKSINGEEPYSDYYVWEDPKNGKEPNNWLSMFSNSAWTFNNKRKQYYYHQFLSDQPDLNVRNPKVVEELKDILTFWLDKGVHGFRMDAVKFLFEDIELRSEPPSNDPDHPSHEYEALDHIYTSDQPETFELLREFRQLLDTYNKTDNIERIMMTESYGETEEIVKYYGNKSAPIAHFPFNFDFIQILNNDNLDPSILNITIYSWLYEMPKPIGWPNWVTGNHDVNRVGTRFGKEFIDIMNMLIMLLPGTPITYYGEEIGMVDHEEISYDETQDPYGKNVGRKRYKLKSRDPERTPMQWSNETNAGFSQVNPWLPINNNYKSVNVKAQARDPGSHLNIYKNLVKLRKENAFLFGNTSLYVGENNTFYFTRVAEESKGFCVLLNLGNTTTFENISEATGVPKHVVTELSTFPVAAKMKYSSKKVPIKGKSGMVLSFVQKLK